MSVLTSAKRQFVLHWGEMGTRWGINRTVAQIHALLHISKEPLTAEDIAAELKIARSNVSTSMRELQGWGLVRPAHVFGDRRAHFESVKDVWEMFRIIIDQRKRREIDPTMEVLKLCLAEIDKSDGGDPYAKERLKEIFEFFADVDALYADIRQLPLPTLRGLVRARGKVRKILSKLGK